MDVVRSYRERLARGRLGIGWRAFGAMAILCTLGLAFAAATSATGWAAATTVVVVPGRSAVVIPAPSKPAPTSAKPCSTFRMYRPLFRPAKPGRSLAPPPAWGHGPIGPFARALRPIPKGVQSSGAGRPPLPGRDGRGGRPGPPRLGP